jgi:S1-C subfamily serine protease
VRRAGVIASVMALTALGILVATGDGSDAARGGTSGDRLELGVVAIDARIGDRRVRSSGAVVDARAGLVVTSAHSVWGATSLRLTTGLGVLHGRLVARAPCAGLAVIEIQPRVPGLVALPAAGGGAPPAGEPLRAIGRREGDLVTIPLRSAGTVASAPVEAGLPPVDDALKLDAAVVPESTGGPVLNAGGELVGMAMATTKGGALAIPWAIVDVRLGELEVDEHRVYVGWRDYYRCAPQLHAYAKREHPGYRASDAVINAPVPATRLPGTHNLDDAR